MSVGAESVGDGFDPERVQQLRRAVHSFLQQSNVYDNIRDIIDSYIADHPEESVDPHSSDDVLKIVREKGLVRSLMSRLHQEQSVGNFTGAKEGLAGGAASAAATGGPESNVHATDAASFASSWMGSIVPGQQYLHVRLAGGRAILENIDLSPSVSKGQQLVVVLQFGGQRFRSSPQPCVVDPTFNDDCVLHIDRRPFGGISGCELLDVSTPLHIALINEDRCLARCKMVGENTVDWRRALRTGYLGLTVELSGGNQGVPAGIIELQLELLPSGIARYSEDDIVAKIDSQRSSIIAADREFLVYARRWWAEFQGIRPAHQNRRVKVFAASSNGRMVPVTHFVSPLVPDRSIETPHAAARFVSLFGLSSDEDSANEVLLGGASVGGGGRGPASWLSTFSFLSQRRGEQCNHATLLCSLLLGFGLDAYCVIGTEREGRTHMFVLTRRRISPGESEVVFWEPTTGDRFTPTGPHPYTTIGCVFNDRCFYANIQPSDSALSCAFNLDNEQLWKPLNVLKLRMVPKYPNAPLLWIPVNARLMEWELEAALMRAVGEYRDSAVGLHTRYNDGLGCILTQALCAYESQRCSPSTGGSIGSGSDMSTFHACVKGKIGEGMTFKGIPLNITHVDERKILSTLLSTAAGKDILELVGDELSFAIRVKIYPFPESILSVWVMVAATYRVNAASAS